MIIVPKAIYMFNVISIKIPMTLSQRLKNLPKEHLETEIVMLEVSQYLTLSYSTEPLK
jgi:hypothetical protein